MDYKKFSKIFRQVKYLESQLIQDSHSVTTQIRAK